jgi:hypothetical protein
MMNTGGDVDLHEIVKNVMLGVVASVDVQLVVLHERSVSRPISHAL